MRGLGIVVALKLLLWTCLLYVPLRWRPVGLYLWVFKVSAVAFAPFIAAFGVAVSLAGRLRGSSWTAVPSGIAAVGALGVVVRLGSVRPDLTGVLGAGWENRIPPERRARMVGRFWRGRLPRDPEPRVRQDVAFASIPGTDRVLVCDVWHPPADVPASGVCLVYLYGSGYYTLDKDVGTRALFRHLTAQGHVVVDVAYRLFPETDVPGMVADAKRAVAWVTAQAAELGIDPAKIVLAGGSSGGHLSLLAAYAHDDPILTPPELADSDPRVCAVVSLYGQVDLAALYEHTGQRKTCGPDDPQPDWEAPTPRWALRLFGADAGRLKLQFLTAGGRCDWLMGGTPSEVPERYAQVSAVNHVRPGCPPTLLIHGLHDQMAPVAAVRVLRERLDDAGVPVAAVYLPHTDHAFDIGTTWSPAARVAVHILERFLAGLATSDQRAGTRPSPSGARVR
jgi:acetyl esterase/lipase